MRTKAVNTCFGSTRSSCWSEPRAIVSAIDLNSGSSKLTAVKKRRIEVIRQVANFLMPSNLYRKTDGSVKINVFDFQKISLISWYMTRHTLKRESDISPGTF